MNIKAILAATIALASCLAAAAQDYFGRIATEGVELVGAITFGQVDKYTLMDAGFYTFPFDRKFQPVKTSPDYKTLASGGAVYHDGKIYSNEFADDYQVQKVKPKWRVYDADTYKLLSEHELPDNCDATTSALAYDITDNTIYGFNYTYTETYFVRVDPETGAMTRVGNKLDYNCKYMGIAATSEGSLYCVYMNKTSNEWFLARIRKSDGRIAVVSSIKATNLIEGDSFINSAYKQALFYNNATKKLYWIFGGESDFYYYQKGDGAYTAITEVNPVTAEARLVAYLPDQFLISGAFLKEPNFKAPATVTDLVFTPDEVGALTGKVSFTVPTKDYLGNDLTGDVTVTVSENGKEITSVTAAPGTAFTSDRLTFTNESHTLTVSAKNTAGKGPAASRSFYVGYDVPSTCQNISLSADGLKTTLTWEAPVAGQNGAPIDPSNYTYTVVRYPNEVTVATGLKEMRFEEEHPADMTRYVYAVYAVDPSGRNGKAAYSNNLIVGTPLNPPYGGIFASMADLLNYYTILDENNDSRTWMYDATTASTYYNFSEKNDADDWLISPPINYKKGVTYELTFKAYSSLADYPEAMQVRFGDGRTPESQSKLLLDMPEIPGASEATPVQQYKAEFTPEADGVYYYSFHAVTEAYHGFLYLFDIRVAQKADAGVDVADTDDAGISVAVSDGELRISNPMGKEVIVSDLSGRTLAKSSLREISRTLPAGVYIVRAAGQSVKVVVR